MTFKQYSTLANATILYPESGHNIIYPTLGLVGEAREFAQKLADVEYYDGLALELGDACWYLNALCFELGYPFSRLELFDYTANRATPLWYCCGKLNGVCGRIAEHVKKMLRDDGQVLTRERKNKIIMLLPTVILWVFHCASEIDHDMPTILRLNAEKLKDRQLRNVLQGEGDHR